MSDPVLLVEDDISIAIVITTALEDEGLKVVRCDTIAERDRLLGARTFSLMLTDVVLKDGDGIETIDVARNQHPDMPIIILSAQNTLDTAVRATDSGAFEYFPKPFDLDELIHAVKQGIGSSAAPVMPTQDEGMALPLVGRSPAMQAVYRMITRVLRNDLTVLILGESGTGKELVAEAIHQLGGRGRGPFVAINTAAIPAELIESELFGHEKGAFTGAVNRHIGKFEQAQGGTLFLDEIGDMPMQAQTRLLRALQSGMILRVGGREEVPFDARIIAATNKDLAPMIAEGTFREDLYYRLNVVPIQLPPLRERGEDIAALSRHFLNQAARDGLPVHMLSDGAADLLCLQQWRGNVRELKNFIYRVALMARDDVIDEQTIRSALVEDGGPLRHERAAVASGVAMADRGDDLAGALGRWLTANSPASGEIYAKAIAAFEKPLFAHMLDTTGGNQLRAAQMLGINRNTLRKRLVELEIDPDGFAAKGHSAAN
ncbi:response regulator [Croceicoccus ponticola]|uniref:DNA-binding transcriptional regulator NtrC n=1 Tax=Croceicoccus ponticola TaxID=2217664 RepID=A0A437H0V7_9SPHN|nr:sigma 54-interacting transcriptional regulator [Croceicoccus ponticola]RVQ69163.1 response regulator [Croceicoccus ponticola]